MVLDMRRMKQDNTYPIKLRVTFERKQVYYKTPYDLTEKDFQSVMFSQRLSKEEKVLKKKISAYENKASDIIELLPLFRWQTFEKHYLANRGSKEYISHAFAKRAAELRKAGQIGTAVSYECAQKSLATFIPAAKFQDINPDTLRRYEKWMLDKGNSFTTISMYLRSLRALFNTAMEEGLLTKDYYPFGKKRYEIPSGNNIKKALALSDIGKIFGYKPVPLSMADKAKDFWIFMYLANGCNVKDLCLLKYENIKGDILEFERAKTSRTKRKVEPIRVSLGSELKHIIRKWGNPGKENKTFIFPILENNLTAERERQLIQQLTRIINDHMKLIGRHLKIEQNLTTYVARHSFATVLQRSGVAIARISEALGHRNSKTTQDYLGGFEDDTKKHMAKALTAFKNPLKAVG